MSSEIWFGKSPNHRGQSKRITRKKQNKKTFSVTKHSHLLEDNERSKQSKSFSFEEIYWYQIFAILRTRNDLLLLVRAVKILSILGVPQLLLGVPQQIKIWDFHCTYKH